MGLECLIFDLDGTLIYPSPIDWDLVKARVVNFFKGFGVEIKPTPIIPNIKMGSKKLEEMGVMSYREGVRKAFEILDAAEVEVIDLVRPVTDLKGFFGKLKELGYRVAIVTLNGKKFTELVLAKFSIKKFVDYVSTRDDVENPKPNPDQIILVLEKLGVEKSRAAMIGDRVVDIVAAKKAGVIPIGVLTGNSGEEELRKSGAKIVLKSIEELLDLLNRKKFSRFF